MVNCIKSIDRALEVHCICNVKLPTSRNEIKYQWKFLSVERICKLVAGYSEVAPNFLPIDSSRPTHVFLMFDRRR